MKDIYKLISLKAIVLPTIWMFVAIRGISTLAYCTSTFVKIVLILISLLLIFCSIYTIINEVIRIISINNNKTKL